MGPFPSFPVFLTSKKTRILTNLWMINLRQFSFWSIRECVFYILEPLFWYFIPIIGFPYSLDSHSILPSPWRWTMILIELETRLTQRSLVWILVYFKFHLLTSKQYLKYTRYSHLMFVSLAIIIMDLKNFGRVI